MPAPTPQLLEAFSVEPQGSAGFFFRFKYSIQPAFSSYCSSPLSSVVSGVFWHLMWATARPLPGRFHHYLSLSDPNSPQSSSRTSGLLSDHSGLVDVAQHKDIACTQTNISCHLSGILNWYYSYSLHTMVTDSPIH